MKIVDFNTLVHLPNDTIYCEYEPCIFDNIKVRKNTLVDEDNNISDWFYQELVSNPDITYKNGYDLLEVCKEMENGKSISPDFDTQTRDAMYDNSRKFLIYEKEDIKLFIDKLTEIYNNIK